MRKKIFSLALILIFFGGLLFVSCDKDTQNSPVEPNLTKIATLKGLVYANLSERNDTLPNLPANGIQREFAPAGTLIQIRVDATQYSSQASGYFLYSATVGSNGEYSVEIPTRIQGVTAEIIPIDFEYDKVVGYWDWTGTEYVWEGKSERTVYSTAIINAGGLIPDGVRIIDINY
jgi:hypothetical protein